MSTFIDKVKFYAMRTVKIKPIRDAITQNVARRIGKGQKFTGNSSFITQNVQNHFKNLNLNGFTELDNLLSTSSIEQILNHIKPLKCYDPFHRKLGEFYMENLPSVTHVANFRREDLLPCKAIMDIANDPGILNIIQEYLGAKPTISNVNMWWSIGGHEQARDAQLFHRDVDDFKFCKLFIYLTDVDADSGPHTYVKGSSASSKLMTIRRYQDEEVTSVFGENNVIEFIRPKGSGFIVDTYGFHKGLLPKKKNRLLLQVQYSLNPIGIENYNPLTEHKYNYDSYTNRCLLS
jgi:hypothetical protein